MNGTRALTHSLWVVAGAGLVAGIASAAVPRRLELPADESRPSAQIDLSWLRRRPTRHPDRVVARNLFRLDRQPAPRRYPIEPEGVEPEPPSLRPPFRLTGLAMGHLTSAVIEGFPGVTGGRVVRAGEEVAGFRIRAIRRDAVIITAADTVWVLGWGIP